MCCDAASASSTTFTAVFARVHTRCRVPTWGEPPSRRPWWAAGQTREVLLAPAGREPLDPTPVRVDAPADLGAACADRLMGDGRKRPAGPREGATREGCPRNGAATRLSAGITTATAAVLTCGSGDKNTGRTRGRTGVGCCQSCEATSEMSDQWQVSRTRLGCRPTAIALRLALQSPYTDGRGRPPADYFGLSIWSAQ